MQVKNEQKCRAVDNNFGEDVFRAAILVFQSLHGVGWATEGYYFYHNEIRSYTSLGHTPGDSSIFRNLKRGMPTAQGYILGVQILA